MEHDSESSYLKINGIRRFFKRTTCETHDGSESRIMHIAPKLNGETDSSQSPDELRIQICGTIKIEAA